MRRGEHQSGRLPRQTGPPGRGGGQQHHRHLRSPPHAPRKRAAESKHFDLCRR
jgi:hypothetical protein